MLFHRLALSKEKDEVMRLAQEGQIIEKPEDILKEPYVFEFAGLPALSVYNEGDLEDALIANFGQFFLEMGKGYVLSRPQHTGGQAVEQGLQGQPDVYESILQQNRCGRRGRNDTLQYLCGRW